MSFDTRYKQLNAEQRQAVEMIDGPLLVVAGPGTGKTELLSMRTANILRQTDTRPESILCLTFTDSGAAAMRSRLSEIIGADAYKVAIHTFHSFGTEIINQNGEYFYRGAHFQPADDIASYEILSGIFDELDHTSPLSGKMNGEYTHFADTVSVISELKKAGLSSDELLAIINANDSTLDAVEKDLSVVFADTISMKMLEKLAPLAERVASLPVSQLPLGITPLANVLALSMAHAFDEAMELGKTTPITAWRNQWLEKDTGGTYIFKDRKRHAKLRAIAHIYFSYLARMEQAGLYDYDDMILNVVHGLELHPDLRYNLQEQFHYIMVDEFQDTNLAQLRILFNLTLNHLSEDVPNIMAVGDDDQAIYSFQGADVSNIHRFREAYPAYKSIVLKQNYRSSQNILDAARTVITQGDNRLETTMDISKELHANRKGSSAVSLIEHPNVLAEYRWLAETIARDIKRGTKPASIAVLARRHRELVALLPYLSQHGIHVNYEKSENVLDLEPIQTLELLAEVTVALFGGDHDTADSLLPDLLAHPMFEFDAEEIWRLSLKSHRDHMSWLEAMLVSETFAPLAAWLITRAQAVPHDTLEVFIDTLIGSVNPSEGTNFCSPYFNYYFGQKSLEKDPSTYLTFLEALRALRTKLREYLPDKTTHIADFLECIHLYRDIHAPIKTLQHRMSESDTAINLLTAHKAKGLEFDTVYVLGSVDSSWGEQVRTRSRLISYPENLLISPNADTYDERLRLYYVAMTRARANLVLSYALASDTGRSLLPASFLLDLKLTASQPKPAHTSAELITAAETAWRERIVDQPSPSMKTLLRPVLESYKLSATHLNSFIDITRGGPKAYLMSHLLHFPQAKSANASFGSAIHRVLQRAHMYFVTNHELRPTEDILGDFIHELEREQLSDDDFRFYQKRGNDCLRTYLSSGQAVFTPDQKTELSFAHQGAVIGEARLTGSIDLLDINDTQITVTDYKTGKPSSSWKGTSDAEKIKLHKYKQQLMFYQLLTGHSRDYAKYEFVDAVLQFVEPDSAGQIHALRDTFSIDELNRFELLIQAVWHCIMTLDFPDTEEFAPTYKGVLAFEEALIDRMSKKQ